LQKSVPKLLIGNKSDLSSQRTVRSEEGKELADRLGVQYIETSAKNSQNVKLAFETLSRSILSNSTPSNATAKPTGTKISASKPVSSGCCRS